MPPMGSKEKGTELGWQTVLRASGVQREPLKEKGVIRTGRLSAAEGNGQTSVVFWKEPQKCCFKTTHTREEAELP